MKIDIIETDLSGNEKRWKVNLKSKFQPPPLHRNYPSFKGYLAELQTSRFILRAIDK